jgi:4-amino-4-deoxy-L-arabinose transferase-like glycosyltransferase
LLLLAGIGVVRIVFTYDIFSQTWDEPAHIATGMEWLERGTYTLEPLHPPLARVAVALGPYLSGARLISRQNMWEEGNQILYAHDRYLNNLSLARLGVLPFFLLATLLVWQWTRTRYGEGSAFISTLLFTTCPVVLAHSSVATTDMALVATFTAVLVVFMNLLTAPSYFRSALLGLAFGTALLSKFSALVFVPPSLLAMLLWRWWLRRDSKEKKPSTRRFRWRWGLTIFALVMSLTIWSGYRFSVRSPNAAHRQHETIDHLLGLKGTLHNLAYSIEDSLRIPAPGFFEGLADLGLEQAKGHKSYLLGQVRQTGWWYFFPVALAVKTTLPLLVLVGIGMSFLANFAWREKDWVAATPLIVAFTLVLVCVSSHIDIGVRHILPIYALFAIIGGVGACHVWKYRRPKYLGPALVLALLSWHVISSIRAHPDYLAYFNELAGEHPERILVVSDLDWGQDLLRLSAVLQQKRVEQISIAYSGSADLSRFNLPPFRLLYPHQQTTGWIAISLISLKTGGLFSPGDSYSWLEAYKPVCTVGHSIRLYYVPSTVEGSIRESIYPTGVICEYVPQRLAQTARHKRSVSASSSVSDTVLRISSPRRSRILNLEVVSKIDLR